jgi:hypothetical protein
VGNHVAAPVDAAESETLITKGEAETSIELVVPPVPVSCICAGPGGGFEKIMVHVVAVVQDTPVGQYIAPLILGFTSVGGETFTFT